MFARRVLEGNYTRIITETLPAIDDKIEVEDIGPGTVKEIYNDGNDNYIVVHLPLTPVGPYDMTWRFMVQK